jgi:hypothetical protein
MTIALNFPTNKKIVGENIWDEWNGYGLIQAWAAWNTGWWDHLKECIDHAYGIGANTIRLVGDMGFLRTGTFNQATYESRWAQVISYCAALGLYVYPCMTGAGEYQGVAPVLTFSEMATSVISLLNSWNTAGFTNIIGVDLMNEGNTPSPPVATALTHTNACNYIDLVRAGGTGFPLTISTYESFESVPTFYAGSPSVLLDCDFMDFHVYLTTGSWTRTPTQADVQAGPFSWNGVDVIFGEFGRTFSAGATARRAWINAVVDLFSTPNPVGGATWKVRGGLHWNTYDQSADVNNMWGSFTTSWTPYAEHVQPIVNASGSAASPSAPGQPKNAHDNVLLVSPNGTTTDFASIKVYKDGSTTPLATQGHGYFVDPSMHDGLRHTYTATVVNGSGVESSPSAQLIIPGDAVRLFDPAIFQGGGLFDTGAAGPTTVTFTAAHLGLTGNPFSITIPGSVAFTAAHMGMTGQPLQSIMPSSVTFTAARLGLVNRRFHTNQDPPDTGQAVRRSVRRLMGRR